MKEQIKNNPLIQRIVEEEKQKYNITIDIETPTVIEYYKQNLIDKKISISRVVNTILAGMNVAGYSKTEDNYICIFDKKGNLDFALKHPLKYMQDPSITEAITTFITYHEIRHILQYQKAELFTDYEHFCINYLRELNTKYILNNEYHDSQYLEIDADIYGFDKTKEKFKENKTICSYLQQQESKAIYRKNTYKFDYYFNNFIKKIQNGFNEETYQYNPYLNIFWNKDGTFKKLFKIINNSRFLKNSLLTARIITSDAYMATIDFDNMTIEEQQAIDYQVEQIVYALNQNKNNITKLYKDRRISVFEYQIGTQIIENEIERKEKYKNNNQNKTRKK